MGSKRRRQEGEASSRLKARLRQPRSPPNNSCGAGEVCQVPGCQHVARETEAAVQVLPLRLEAEGVPVVDKEISLRSALGRGMEESLLVEPSGAVPPTLPSRPLPNSPGGPEPRRGCKGRSACSLRSGGHAPSGPRCFHHAGTRGSAEKSCLGRRPGSEITLGLWDEGGNPSPVRLPLFPISTFPPFAYAAHGDGQIEGLGRVELLVGVGVVPNLRGERAGKKGVIRDPRFPLGMQGALRFCGKARSSFRSSLLSRHGFSGTRTKCRDQNPAF